MNNFFEHQDEAHRNTRYLMGLMVAGVLCMGVAIYALLVLIQRYSLLTSADMLYAPVWWQPQMLLASVAGTAVIVLVASAGRSLSLRSGGGSKVAEMLGGRLVSGAPRDVLERRFVNVLEEMSIASGMPVPQAYVLDNEVGINAFAAGFSTQDAVVAVTRGCLEKLTREELQGVVAHEMSHITHGDMRINMRLMGVVFGIVCIALLGRLLLRFGHATGGRSSRNRDSKGGLPLVLFGLGVFLIGSLGEMFGKLIKAAIGRQREYLADAAAVQFTRNPHGIAGALKKIGGFTEGSRMSANRAEEASHMFFGDIHRRFTGLLATHPPLDERIRRVDPSWDGVTIDVPAGIAQPQEVPASGMASGLAASSAGRAAQGLAGVTAASMVASVGTLSPVAVGNARRWLSELSPVLRDGVHEPFTACTIACALLGSDTQTWGERERRAVAEGIGPAVLTAAERLLATVRALRKSRRLALVELVAPALRQLSVNQRDQLLRSVRGLIEADGHVSLFEHVMGEMLVAQLRERPSRDSGSRRRSLRAVKSELELLLSLLAHAGAATAGEAEQAFGQGAGRLPELGLSYHGPRDGQLRGLPLCLAALRELSPALSERVIDGMAHCALANQRVNDDEVTLLAAVCEALDVPLPAWADAEP